MVGYHDGVDAGAKRALGRARGHDALEDEGRARVVADGADLGQLALVLGTRGRLLAAQEGQAGGVDVHRHGGGTRGQGLSELMLECDRVPGLDRGDTLPAELADEGGRARHYLPVEAVTGEGERALGRRGAQGALVVGHGVVLLAVVALDVSHGPDHDRQREVLAKQHR